MEENNIEKIIVINESDFESREEALFTIGEQMEFNNFSDMNLDAFWDCLKEVFQPVRVVMIPENKCGCSSWMQDICSVLKDAAEEWKTINVVCANNDEW